MAQTTIMIRRRVGVSFICCCTWLAFFCGKGNNSAFDAFVKQFVKQYQSLGIPGFEYDYRDYFRSIPPDTALQKQKAFFNGQKHALASFQKVTLSKTQHGELAHIAYEVDFNLYRLSLEEEWARAGRHIPVNGLHELPGHKAWYTYFIKKFTATEITPEQVFDLGKHEVARVQKEIDSIRLSLGYTDSIDFYKYLHDASFYITDKDSIIRGFAAIDSMMRLHLAAFIGTKAIPGVYAMQWPDANRFTPPGMYLPRTQNAYGKDVFQFNFSTGRYNYRAMDWLYMHEAIPGHHLQYSLGNSTELQELFLYPGNFEGWGCYVEYLGKEFGLYTDPYAYLGKWEWDLVRSARLVLDAGIHYYGWTHQQALDYWKTTIPGQDDIAEREITRVTNWCGQALSYKVGARYIMQMKERYLRTPGATPVSFHRQFLDAGRIPLTVMRMVLLG